MTNFAAVLALSLALTPPQKPDRSEGHGLPIRFSGEAGVVEVPLDTGQLGWEPKPTRTLLIERREPPRRDDGGEAEPEPINRQVPIDVRDRAVMSKCFDLWLYGDLTEQDRRIWLLTALSEKVAFARRWGLSGSEEEKLILAGRGDIKRFLDRIEEERAEFEAVRKDYTAGRAYLSNVRMLALSAEFSRGPFGDGSLFSKTLRKIERERAR